MSRLMVVDYRTSRCSAALSPSLGRSSQPSTASRTCTSAGAARTTTCTRGEDRGAT